MSFFFFYPSFYSPFNTRQELLRYLLDKGANANEACLINIRFNSDTDTTIRQARRQYPFTFPLFLSSLLLSFSSSLYFFDLKLRSGSLPTFDTNTPTASHMQGIHTSGSYPLSLSSSASYSIFSPKPQGYLKVKMEKGW
jgi:hypothetical protein